MGVSTAAEHRLQFHCDAFIPVGENMIPTGAVRDYDLFTSYSLVGTDGD